MREMNFKASVLPDWVRERLPFGGIAGARLQGYFTIFVLIRFFYRVKRIDPNPFFAQAAWPRVHSVAAFASSQQASQVVIPPLAEPNRMRRLM